MSAVTEFYRELYRRFDHCTPLDGKDCGLLCGGACCRGDEEDGMFLYPGEEELLRGASFLTITESEFTVGGKAVSIAVCRGKCDRSMRPLACRIFPLFPYVKQGSRPTVIMDPRANALCPLARVLEVRDLSPAFVRAVERTALLLDHFRDTHRFLLEQSELLDELSDSYEILKRIMKN